MRVTALRACSLYVAAVARPQHTYSIGFGKGTYNESQQAGELAELLKLNNTAESLTDEEAFAAFPRIQWHLDEPDSNPSCVPLYFLSALAAKDVKVVLSGEGADELFAGYIDYGVHTKFKPIKVVTRWLTHLPAGARKAIARFCKGKTFPGAWHLYANLAPAEESFIGQARVFEESQSEQLLKPEYRKAPSVQSIVDKTYARVEGKGLSELKKKQYLDMHQWMPGDILLKADKMTMAHSLELRVPLLDKELMGVAEQVPTKYLITDENTKYAFRQAAGRHLPKEWYCGQGRFPAQDLYAARVPGVVQAVLYRRGSAFCSGCLASAYERLRVTAPPGAVFAWVRFSYYKNRPCQMAEKGERCTIRIPRP